MNGAQSLIQTLVNGGVEVCFTNPGTSEIHFVAAVDQVEGMRTVLGLFEGVCAGAASAPPHDWLFHTGGAIGFGMPVAIGAAVACPDRKVINMQSDGSAMYTVQALWTQAREGLDIVTVLFSNRAYAILQVELKRLGADAGGPKAQAMLDLGDPDIGWVKLAQGLGVNASQATTAEAFNQQLESAIKSKGPHLIEVVL